MAVKIRLARMGAKKKPFYRIVITNSTSPRDGNYIEIVGTYNPHPDPVEIRLNDERIKEWIKRGAKPSQTVKSILKKRGIIGTH
ncbi:MAG: 30S ribosomal protein S16 [Thermodesulfobacteriota bacterium]|nr:30S ribosomal protein S16 [Thermodesulfobacteriota bacterium]